MHKINYVESRVTGSSEATDSLTTHAESMAEHVLEHAVQYLSGQTESFRGYFGVCHPAHAKAALHFRQLLGETDYGFREVLDVEPRSWVHHDHAFEYQREISIVGSSPYGRIYEVADRFVQGPVREPELQAGEFYPEPGQVTDVRYYSENEFEEFVARGL